MKHIKDSIFLAVLIIALISINYGYINGFLVKNFSEGYYETIERVIDGDTVVVNGSSYRLLGINTPEKGEYLYLEAKDFLSGIVLNKTVRVEKQGKDLYGRELVYLFYGGGNINLEIVRKGYANYYFPEGKQKYYEQFVDVWEECVIEGINLCKPSENKCAECIELKELNIKNQIAVFYNRCSFECNLEGWSIKDEGRKKYIFENLILNPYSEVLVSADDFGNNYVWTSSGDTLFLRDEKGDLVLWEGY